MELKKRTVEGRGGNLDPGLEICLLSNRRPFFFLYSFALRKQVTRLIFFRNFESVVCSSFGRSSETTPTDRPTETFTVGFVRWRQISFGSL